MAATSPPLAAGTNNEPSSSEPSSTIPSDVPSFDSSSQSSAEVLDTIHRLLGSRIKVTMSDGRIVSGKFSCLDRLGNIMLEDVVEQRQIAYQDVADTGDKKETNSDDSSNANQYVQHTKDENGLCLWTTERSLTQAVIIGAKVSKVEVTKRDWAARIL